MWNHFQADLQLCLKVSNYKTTLRQGVTHRAEVFDLKLDPLTLTQQLQLWGTTTAQYALALFNHKDFQGDV